MITLDCGDNSCYFTNKYSTAGENRVRTNGGCRCFTNAGFNTRSGLTAAIQMLPELLQLRQEIADLKKNQVVDNPKS